jgi:hypothetical protein
MKKLPTRIAEKVYNVLTKFADAKSDYYSREMFIFHYGVTSNTSDAFTLSCMDDAKRTFICKEDGRMWLDGKGGDRVNPILHKITKDLIGNDI